MAIAVVAAAAMACGESDSSGRDGLSRPAASRDSAGRRASTSRSPFRVPNESEAGDSVTLASVRRGRALIHSTRDSLPAYVGNALNCANCHAGDGTVRDAMPLVGAYSRFPQYRTRSGKVELLEDRINDCFLRSMNGKALDRGGRDMRDIVGYIAFLSRGYPVGVDMEGQGVPKLEPLPGDTSRGREVPRRKPLTWLHTSIRGRDRISGEKNSTGRMAAPRLTSPTRHSPPTPGLPVRAGIDSFQHQSTRRQREREPRNTQGNSSRESLPEQSLSAWERLTQPLLPLCPSRLRAHRVPMPHFGAILSADEFRAEDIFSAIGSSAE